MRTEMTTVADATTPKQYWLLTHSDGTPRCFRLVSERDEASVYMAATTSVVAQILAAQCGSFASPLPPTTFVEMLFSYMADDWATGVVVLTERIVEANPRGVPIISLASLLRSKAVASQCIALGEASRLVSDGQHVASVLPSSDPHAHARKRLCATVVPVLENAVRELEAKLVGETNGKAD